MDTRMDPSPILHLPEPLLDRITSNVVRMAPELHLALLSDLGHTVHLSALRVLFSAIVVQDDARAFSTSNKGIAGPVSAIIQNPTRYGSAVRRIEVVNSLLNPVVESYSLWLPSDGVSTGDELRLAPAQDLENLLRQLPLLNAFVWESTSCPPEGICEMLSKYNVHLTSFSYLPAYSLLPQVKGNPKRTPMRWNGLSLPMLATLNLTTLRVSRLSHMGAKSFANLLYLLGDDSMLEDLVIDTNWLDETLCRTLGIACRRTKKLEVGSDGTRLNDKCLQALLPLCENLEDFTLGDIQGKLSKSLWENVDEYPSALRRVRIRISEYTLQHAWAIDHLASLHHLPLHNLTHLSVTRVYSPFKSTLSDAAALRQVPGEFVQSLRTAKQLRDIECDWWSWRREDMSVPLEHCSSLRFLRVALNAPFSKVFTMASTFSRAMLLEKLAVYIPDEHCPVVPPSPPISIRHAPSRSPSVSPILRNRALSTSIGASESLNDDGSAITQGWQVASNHSAHPRDIKKFARRCNSLREIFWYDRQGTRGHWEIIRPALANHTSSNVVVENSLANGTDSEIWNRYRSEWDPSRTTWPSEELERDGANWTGPHAEYYASLRASEKERESQSLKQEKTIRAALKKNGPTVEVPFPKVASKSNAVPSADDPTKIPSPVSPVEPKAISTSRKYPHPKRRTSTTTSSFSNDAPLPNAPQGRPRSQSQGQGITRCSLTNNGTLGTSSCLGPRKGSGIKTANSRRTSHPGSSQNVTLASSSTRGGAPRRGIAAPLRNVA